MIRLLALTLVLFAAPATAIPLGGDAAAEEAAPAEPSQAIEDVQDDGADERIAERISGIFAELPALSAVTVSVEEGVVSLDGTVADQADIDRAAAIAGRVTGVVTVENGLERDLSLDSGVGGLVSLGDRFNDLVALLPLIGLALGVAIIIVMLGYLLASFSALWRRITPNSFLAELVASAIRFASVVLALVVALDMIGAAALMGAVLGGAGVIGIALGFAMRDTVENYVASLMLSLRQPFRPNDHVLIDEHEGRIIRLTSRATIMMTMEGNHLRIPNGQVFKATILNYTRNPQRQFDFELGIDADDDPDAARQLGRETLAAMDFVLDEPEPEARTIAVGDSNIVISFLGWVDQREADWHKARSRAIAAVKKALEEAGFGLPEPIYRLRFDPRTTALPFENIAAGDARSSTASAKEAEKAKGNITAIECDEDVRPADEVAQMVNQERAAKPGDNDLLDEGRPVE
ncbi:mechanosensitive ion channel domain-containing protein [Sphingomicrobium flavum]|uniref:mechanosensitive ion channel domain-containing protein n=1 Tax=Sphingomicrobium flavum TaxID=1229164 RepID=UPI0021ADCC48|nr:mechanosensitive ion channel domain-containing protein [Sphingomicrobium flavum]